MIWRKDERKSGRRSRRRDKRSNGRTMPRKYSLNIIISCKVTSSLLVNVALFFKTVLLIKENTHRLPWWSSS